MGPSPNGCNGDNGGRDTRGRFAAGNAGGPGNPYAKKVAEFRRALVDAVTPEDLEAVAKALVRKAKAGEIPAIRELLDRLLGKPVQTTAVALADTDQEAELRDKQCVWGPLSAEKIRRLEQIDEMLGIPKDRRLPLPPLLVVR